MILFSFVIKYFIVQIYFCRAHKLVSLYRNPRWSSGQDFALSPRRPGFDSPSGKTFLLDVNSHNANDFRRQAMISGVTTTVCCEPKPF